MRRLLAEQKGFSIVEMMVVLSVIAILVGIAVVSYNISFSQAKEVACRHNQRVIYDEANLYRNENGGQYPDLLDDLKPDYLKDGFEFKCPATRQTYLYDPNTGEVLCSIPEHND